MLSNSRSGENLIWTRVVRNRCAIWSLMGLLAAGAAAGREVRVVRFYVPPPDFSPPPCISYTQWTSETYFYNATDTNQVVRFLGVSNGDPDPNPRPLTIAPRQPAVLTGTAGLGWQPVQPALLWVNRLDVPEGVIVADRIMSAIHTPDHINPPCTGRGSYNGGLPLPVFTALTPAGKPQYHLGIGLGATDTQALFPIADARINVGIYNGGTSSATAIAEVYCGPPFQGSSVLSVLVRSERVTVPTNALVQRTIVSSTVAAGCSAAFPPGAVYYTIVTVDQPSLSYAVGLSNELPPRFPGATSFTYSGE